MRDSLREAEGVRTEFFGTVERFGSKPGFQGHAPVPTILLLEVNDLAGQIRTDHLWFTLTKGFEEAKLQPGDRIRFAARVKPYTKGYRGRRDDDDDNNFGVTKDWRLSHPTNIEITRRGDRAIAAAQSSLFET